jgi:hypothetical protein
MDGTTDAYASLDHTLPNRTAVGRWTRRKRNGTEINARCNSVRRKQKAQVSTGPTRGRGGRAERKRIKDERWARATRARAHLPTNVCGATRSPMWEGRSPARPRAARAGAPAPHPTQLVDPTSARMGGRYAQPRPATRATRKSQDAEAGWTLTLWCYIYRRGEV